MIAAADDIAVIDDTSLIVAEAKDRRRLLKRQMQRLDTNSGLDGAAQ